MLFSDYFNVDKKHIDDYGAVNISLFADTPLFIDPLLIYNNADPKIADSYSMISNYLKYLNNISKRELSKEEINYYFKFKEVKENWLGLSTHGNQGNALGEGFAKELSDSIKIICDNKGITDDVHIEKMYLVKDGVGKDRISDWCANVMLKFFVDYTAEFTSKYIDRDKCKEFEVQRYSFNFDTNLYENKIVLLPCYKKHGSKAEYVLLTPKSILRREEQEISHSNFENEFGIIRKTLPNEELRFNINQFYESERKKVYEECYEKQRTVTQNELNRFEKAFIQMVIDKYPQIYDYFIKKKETDDDSVIEKARKEVESILQIINDNILLNNDVLGFENVTEEKTAFEEAKYRIDYLKNQIERNGFWKNLYFEDKPIQSEDYLQRLFALLWCRSHYRFSPESNSGVGPVDFLVAFGFKNATVVEFKLASNTKLSHVFKQVDEYKKSHRTNGKSLIVIFCFNDSEKNKANNLIYNADKEKYECYIIDCDRDNKKSASNQ